MARKGSRKGKIRKAKERDLAPVSPWAKSPERTRRAQELTIRSAGVHSSHQSRNAQKRDAIRESVNLG